MNNYPVRNKYDSFIVRCQVCKEWKPNEDSILVVEKSNPKDNVWCCKECSTKMIKSLDKHCVFCGAHSVETLFVVDGNIIPVCWSCDLDLE